MVRTPWLVGILVAVVVLVGCGGPAAAPDDHYRGFTPAVLRAWYGLDKRDTGRGQVIVITEAASAPNLAAAVDAFSRRFGLPGVCAGRHTTRCFRLKMLTPAGRPQRAEPQRVFEAELDLEWAHAIAPLAEIDVVTARSDVLPVIRDVGRIARSGGSHVFSTSWCSPCSGGRFSYYASRVGAAWDESCHVARVVCVNATGDRGPPGVTPTSPYFLAVGGSVFSPARRGAPRQVAWSHSGGGATAMPLPLPPWQAQIPCGTQPCRYRLVPDVSGPAAGAPIVISRHGALYLDPNPVGGTSLAAPIWAALIALANQELAAQHERSIGIDELHWILYTGQLRRGVKDITQGNRARPGWDAATGWGSPEHGIVDALVKAIVHYRHQHTA